MLIKAHSILFFERQQHSPTPTPTPTKEKEVKIRVKKLLYRYYSPTMHERKE